MNVERTDAFAALRARPDGGTLISAGRRIGCVGRRGITADRQEAKSAGKSYHRAR